MAGPLPARRKGTISKPAAHQAQPEACGRTQQADLRPRPQLIAFSGSLAAVDPVNIRDLERHAETILDAGVFGYFAGGAADELTLNENVAAFTRLRLLPRVLVDVSTVNASTSLLGVPLAMPVVVAPVAFQRLVSPDGEPGMARAAQAAGSIFTLSTLATARPSAVTAGNRWMQVYVFRDRGVTRAIVDEAVETGFQALVVTVDAPRGGPRERDRYTGFALPADLGVPAIGGRSMTIAETFELMDPSLTWTDLAEIVSTSPLPVLVKGIHTGEDALLAVEHGAAGVVVSNHGGRQLDGVPATIEMLPAIADALGGRTTLLMDGGIRRGTDVLKAVALGADAVMAGRAVLWGLACGGQAGAEAALRILQEEVELGMALLGVTRLSQLSPAYVCSRPTGL
jgi:isopentenyl diphosphate isomerase/L-lactate dehydrogenase-like FMN-dependent dehydrogenase